MQLHDADTGLAPPDPEKVKLPAIQAIGLILTVTDCPGERVPLAGVKKTPLIVLLDVQSTFSCESDVSPRVTVHEL